jgi:hypothetical protein
MGWQSVIPLNCDTEADFLKETHKMRKNKDLLIFLAFFSLVLAAGCRKACKPQQILENIVFQNKWVGDIDQIQFNEPSGICWHDSRETLFLVGDEGDICEIKPDGMLVKQEHVRDADFEGVTHDPSTGLLYIVIEEEEIVLEIHPETFEVLREFSIPRQFKGKTLLNAGGNGIEAITFVPDDEHPEGGVFYAANQAFTLDDEQDISAIFEVELPLRSQKGEPRILSYFTPGVIDLSGLHYDAKTDRLLVTSDAANIILEYSRQHELLSVQAFPGDNQEGITVDPDGFIYIAQDTGGIVKLKWLR